MINFNELKKLNKEREKIKLEPYQKILELISAKIVDSSSVLNQNYCVYKVPEFVFGLPSYDLNECCQWIKKELLKNGVDKVEILEHYIMVITWKL
jgi:hypothetical protein